MQPFRIKVINCIKSLVLLFICCCCCCCLKFVWLDRYKDALVLLLREVLNRIQFRYNQAQLEELDDETLDDDVRTFYIFHSLSRTFLLYTACTLYILQPQEVSNKSSVYYQLINPVKTCTCYKGIFLSLQSLNILFHLVTIATD